MSYVGRPFSLDAVDEHFGRIRDWGFNIVRLLITWEAVEHSGPGLYDEAYLDFLRQLVVKARDHSLMVFIDPHQDVWSRFTGGDGAPEWTFELAGLDPSAFREAQAVQLNSFDWFHNYETVPVATMWTLFWAGDRYCPELRGAQAQLQNAFIAMLATVASRLADLDNVLGYDSCNEPSGGYIGRGVDLAEPVTHFVGDGSGPRPWSALEYLAAGAGNSLASPDGRTLNPMGKSIWRDGCPWSKAGLWSLDRAGHPRLQQEDCFTTFEGRPVDLWGDFMVPFLGHLAQALRVQDPDAILFIEPPPHYLESSGLDIAACCDARHWYDLPTLSTRRFEVEAYRTADGLTVSGIAEIADQFRRELGCLKTWSADHMPNAPMLVGEFGVPYDINGKSAYRSGDYSQQRAALEASYRALEANLLSSTQWNYSASNTHEHGDGWNFEDLSIWSQDDLTDSGGAGAGARATEAFCRPYVMRSAGRPLLMSFNGETGEFRLIIEADSQVMAPTEVFVPRIHYGITPRITVSAGAVQFDLEHQRMQWTGIANKERAELQIHRG